MEYFDGVAAEKKICIALCFHLSKFRQRREAIARASARAPSSLILHRPGRSTLPLLTVPPATVHGITTGGDGGRARSAMASSSSMLLRAPRAQRQRGAAPTGVRGVEVCPCLHGPGRRRLLVLACSGWFEGGAWKAGRRAEEARVRRWARGLPDSETAIAGGVLSFFSKTQDRETNTKPPKLDRDQ